MTKFFCPISSHGPHFLRKNIFFEISGSAMHKEAWASVSFRKKLMSQSRENLWTEGRKDEQTLIHRTLPAMARGPVN